MDAGRRSSLGSCGSARSVTTSPIAVSYGAPEHVHLQEVGVSATSSSRRGRAARQQPSSSPEDPAERASSAPAPQASGGAPAAVLPDASQARPPLPAQVAVQAPIGAGLLPAPAASREPAQGTFREPERVLTGLIQGFVELFKHATDSDKPSERIKASRNLVLIGVGMVLGLAVAAVVSVVVLTHGMSTPHTTRARYTVGGAVTLGPGVIFGGVKWLRSRSKKKRADADGTGPTPPPGGADL